ncbi:MAG: hypothetical protein COA78_14725, partial [Blastopirellula sp.]
QRKFEQAESLLTSVDAEDLHRCTQLILAYETMFGGLPLTAEPALAIDVEDFSEGILAQLHSSEDQNTNQIDSQRADSQRRRRTAWFALATAASLLLIALPFSFMNFGSEDPVAKPASPEVLIVPNTSFVGPGQNSGRLPEGVDNSLAKALGSLAAQIGTPEGASNLGYAEAEPWIEGVSTRLRPLTYSMGTAFTLIRSTAEFPPSESEPSDSKPQAFWRMIIWKSITV